MEKGKSGFLGGIFSIILGFLPSFLIFSVFNRSNFSISRYWEFLMNFNSSWVSWISIIFLTVIIYSLLATMNSKNQKVVFLVIVFVLSFASVIIFLYINFLLGNDVLVRLHAENQNLFFNSSETQEVIFKISAVMNPFCTAQCEYSLIDLSSGETTERGEFAINPLLSHAQGFYFKGKENFFGQEISRFEVNCKSKKSRLCYTSEEESKRAVLITLNYDFSEEQKKINEETKRQIIKLHETIHNFTTEMEIANQNAKEMNKVISFDSYLPLISNLLNENSNLNASFEKTKEKWILQNNSEFEEEFFKLKKRAEDMVAVKEAITSNITSNVSKYNSLINELVLIKEEIIELNLTNISESSCIRINAVVFDFNETKKIINEKNSFSYKEESITTLSETVKEISSLSNEGNLSLCIINKKIDEIPNKINVEFNYTAPNFFIENPLPICCFIGNCEPCCNNSCTGKNYPILFLHGHSFNKETSADYSFDTFSEIKTELQKEGYIDAGTLIISSSSQQKGLWGKANAQVQVTGSYFFDIAKNETGEEIIVSSKTEGIEVYALRLNDLIKTVRERTEKDKVIIITHSMGGLVARRYIQLFGEEEVDRLMMISSPNNGIEKNIKDYCILIGSETECEDMYKDSVLINKLSNTESTSIPIQNIIATGCEMGKDKGDGIVKEFSQHLYYANNTYIKGECNEAELKFLHNRILNPKEYPQTLELIKKFLKE